MAARSLDDFIRELDALFQHPGSGHITWVTVGRSMAIDHRGQRREEGAELALSLIGLGRDDGHVNDHSYLRLSVSLFGSNGAPLTRIEFDRPGTSYSAERRIVGRCLWWCVPRRLPLTLLAKNTAVASWDPRYPLCVPTQFLGVQAQLGALIEVGWQAQPTPDGLRLLRFEAPNALQRAAGGIAGLFGKQTRAGKTTTIDASPAGLRITILDGGEPARDHWFPITSIGALGAMVDNDGRHCPLCIFTNEDVELFAPGHNGSAIARQPVMRALELALVSAMLGVP